MLDPPIVSNAVILSYIIRISRVYIIIIISTVEAKLGSKILKWLFYLRLIYDNKLYYLWNDLCPLTNTTIHRLYAGST